MLQTLMMPPLDKQNPAKLDELEVWKGGLLSCRHEIPRVSGLISAFSCKALDFSRYWNSITID
jgi:hypothetical protein